jgi:hypothetical protein
VRLTIGPLLMAAVAMRPGLLATTPIVHHCGAGSAISAGAVSAAAPAAACALRRLRNPRVLLVH